jgi:hypothetical protein
MTFGAVAMVFKGAHEDVPPGASGPPTAYEGGSTISPVTVVGVPRFGEGSPANSTAEKRSRYCCARKQTGPCAPP